MKKLMFVGILILFISLLSNAQENNAQGNNFQKNVKKEINSYLTSKINSLEELNTKLVDKYGMNKIKFMKLENGNYVPLTPTEGKDISEILISEDVIIIFAIIGAVLVGLILLRAL